jgi:hypothetical protein
MTKDEDGRWVTVNGAHMFIKGNEDDESESSTIVRGNVDNVRSGLSLKYRSKINITESDNRIVISDRKGESIASATFEKGVATIHTEHGARKSADYNAYKTLISAVEMHKFK